MSISLRIDFSQVRGIADAMARLEAIDQAELLEDLGAEGESQARRRLQEEKRSPDGTPWPAWSPAYAETRHGGQRLLQSEGDLVDSLQYAVSGLRVGIGSNLPYAARQNFGDEVIGSGIPARTYLGFSADNLIDLKSVVDDFLQRQLGAL